MSEGQSDYKNPSAVETAIHKAKAKYYGVRGVYPISGPEMRRDIASEKRAKEAVKQYVRISSQEPLATFLGESESIIDLADYQQGTIIRVEQYFPLSDHPETPSYRWFVTGDRKGDLMYIYDISFLDRPYHTPTLPTEGEPQIFAMWPIKLHPFPVKDALFILSEAETGNPENDAREKERYKKMPVTKVDIMSMGRTSKVKKRRPQTRTTNQLQPVTETA